MGAAQNCMQQTHSTIQCLKASIIFLYPRSLMALFLLLSLSLFGAVGAIRAGRLEEGWK